MKREKYKEDLLKRKANLMRAYWKVIRSWTSKVPGYGEFCEFKCNCGHDHKVAHDFKVCACGEEHDFKMQINPNIHRTTPGKFLFNIKKDILVLWVGKGMFQACDFNDVTNALAYIDEDDLESIKFFWGKKSLEELKGFELLK